MSGQQQGGQRADSLQDAICRAVRDYCDYLDRHDLLYDDKRELMRASALHVPYDGCSYEIRLKDGAIDRRYNSGEDPDPEQRGLNPTWPPERAPHL